MRRSPKIGSFMIACVSLVVAPAAVEAQQDWWHRAGEFRTKYYNIKTDLPKEQAAEMAGHMDRTFESYLAMFRGLKLRRIAKLDVYIFAEQSDYMQVLQQRFKNDGTGSAGKCITRGNTISLVAWKGRKSLEPLKNTLQHEGFHQFASNYFPKLPTWANEGLAEVFERGVLIDGKIVLGEVSRTDVLRLRDAKRRNQFKSVGDILTVKQADWNHQVKTGQAGQNYLQAWCLVHCFLYAEESKYQNQFINFLKGINAGAPWEKAFIASFGVPDFTSMDKIWLRYVDTVTPSDYEETIRRLEFLSVGYMKLRDQSVYPTSVNELLTELDKSDFSHESKLFGKPKPMKAGDQKLGEIPYHELWKSKPVFELVDARGRKPAARKTEGTSKKNIRPTKPLLIRTTGLTPQNFSVSWKKDRKSPGGYRAVFSAK